MDFHWYFPQTGGGTTSDASEFETVTITVTEEQSSVDWKTDRINPEELAWQVDAFRKNEDDTLSSVAVETSSSQNGSSTIISIKWTKVFNGFVNISTWRKK